MRWVKWVKPWLLRWYPFLVALVGTVALWLVDIGSVLQIHGLGPATNGFFEVSASRVYHIGLFGALLSIWLLVLTRKD